MPEVKPDRPGPASVIDWGCGTGRASVKFADYDFTVSAVDIVSRQFVPDMRINYRVGCIWEMGMPDAAFPQHDYAFACDVLEHIPPERLHQTLTTIDRFMTVAGFINVPHIPDGGWGTGQLHLIVKPPDWWEAKLGEFFEVRYLGTKPPPGRDLERSSYLILPREGREG